jgi:hypothetical protein
LCFYRRERTSLKKSKSVEIVDWSDELSTIVAARAAPLKDGTGQRGDSAGARRMATRVVGDNYVFK